MRGRSRTETPKRRRKPHYPEPDPELEQARNAFLDAVCAQVHTPLTLMLGPLRESLADDRLPPEERHRVAMAHRAALRLLNLVDSLDDLARIELGLAQASVELVDLGQVVTDVAAPFQGLIELAGLRLAIDRNPSGSVVVCDRDLLEKALLHLVSNAFKHTKEGEIRVRVASSGTRAEVSVIDTGIGISERDLPRVFERFFRVREAWARTYEGSGLGLALVKAVAELHGGTVRLESRPEMGSAFIISLPLAPVDDPVPSSRQAPLAPTRLLEEAAAWKPDQEVDRAGPPPGARVQATDPPRIVVVEESADLRAHLVQVLGRYWDVVGLQDGAKALALVDEDPPDLVLAEVVLPGLDGLALLRALRANPATAMVPVMLIASWPGEEAAVDALERGPDDYLVKPFSGRLLVARIRANLASSRARRQHQAQLQASLEISKATLSGERSETVLQLVAHRARDLLQADGAHVAVPATGEGGLAVTIGEGCASGDLATAARQGRELSGETFGGSLLVVAPLAVQDRQIGVLGVCRHSGGDPFGPEDAQLLALFANQAALAMEQGRVSQEMQRLAVMEEERGRIARDIHDDTLQSLGAIALRLSVVGNRLTDEDQRRSVAGLLELTRDSAERLRTLVFDLRADVLEKGLVHALRSYAFEAPTPLPVQCQIDSRLRREPPMHVSLVLYRVAQEALTNVRKHARASSVRLLLDEVRGGIRLRVSDDGCGCDLSAGTGAPGHLGLAAMRERAELAGGRLSVESSPGYGTTVQVWIPVPGGHPHLP
jgi:signal transduction histidine kinase